MTAHYPATATLWAVIEGMNKFQERRFPSLHHRKEGWLRHKEIVAKLPYMAQTGWFSTRAR
jgi:hypothetical protein